ncbi:ATP-binding protein [Akkermansiaceae bacterium]|nr:ATP-binding protein [Akkermansiaceae bacterium]
MLLAAALILIGSVIDYAHYPENSILFLIVRMGVASLLIVLTGFLRPNSNRNITTISHLAALLPLAMTLWMIFHLRDPDSPLYQALALLIVGTAMVMRWRFIDCFFHSIISILSYSAVYFYLQGPLIELATQLFFLIATAVLSCLGIFYYESYRFREFYLREEVEKNRHTLKATNEQLQALSEAKNRFFANVSHELRTPLTLILGPIEQLTTLPSLQNDPRALTYIDTLSENGFRLMRMINDLLNIAKLDTGDLPERLENINLKDFALSLHRNLSAMAKSKYISFKVEADFPKNPIQVFDHDRLEKILLNLCINALKFTPDGGHVEVTMEEKDDATHFVVSDNGIGLTPEELPHIFERFWQADSSSHRKSRGAGIGLALSKNLAESMGGYLLVNSAPNVGTTFTLVMPVSPPQRDLPKSRPNARKEDSFDLLQNRILSAALEEPYFDEESQPSEPETKSSRILIIDDEPRMRSYIGSFLDNHQIIQAANGEQGFQMAQEYLPNLIILDYMMPEMDGIEVSRLLRNQPATANIPIILITAHGGDAPRLAALEAGVNDFITKPFYSSELVARVSNLLLNQKYYADLLNLNLNLSEALEQLQNQGEELIRSEKLSSLGQMSAGIVHEINNPLNYANTAIHLLKTYRTHIPEDEIEDYDETVADLGDAISRVIRIITDLRTLSRGDELTKTATPFRRIIENSTHLLSHELGSIELLVNIPDSSKVFGNDNQLCQVFVNLVQNAIHATREQDNPKVTIEAKPVDENVIITITDNGHGIPEEIRRRIFDPFFSTKEVGIGMGLGLSLTLKIIKSHGGLINAKNAPKGGTIFTITLPGPRDNFTESQ